MFCCRNAPVRLFVRGLYQLHNFDASATPSRVIASYSRHNGFANKPISFSTTTTRTDYSSREAAVGADVSDAQPTKPSSPEESGAAQPSISPTAELKEPVAGTAHAASGRRAETSTSHKSSKEKTERKPKKNDKKKTFDALQQVGPADVAAAPQEHWRVQKKALKDKFPEGWQPLKRLSPDAIAGIRALHEQYPDEYGTKELADKFEVSPEAIRRILKSRWAPSAEEEEKRRERWFKRGMSVWSRYAELGVKPPQRWRKEGVVREPSYHEKRRAAILRREELEKADAGASLQRKMGGKIL